MSGVRDVTGEDDETVLGHPCEEHRNALDIRLAGGSGVEVARWLKQRGVPSIFMTASLIEAEANRDAVLGCISKPFTDRDVERAVRWAETRQGACAVA